MPHRPALLALTLLLAGCAGGQSVERTFDYPTHPSQEELAALEDAPDRESCCEYPRKNVDQWTLAGPLADAIGYRPVDARGPWEERLESMLVELDGKGSQVDATMRCVSRETGRFFLEHQALPASTLEQYIHSQCGSPAPTHYKVWTWEEPEERSRRHRAQKTFKQVEKPLREALARDHTSAGIWYGTSEEMAVALAAFRPRPFDLQPVAIEDPDRAFVELRGRHRLDDSLLDGRSTRGRLGSKRCEKVGDVEAPNFHLRCPLDETNGWTYVSVSYSDPGSSYKYSFLNSFFWSGQSDRRSYVRRTFAQSLVDEFTREDYSGPSNSEEFANKQTQRLVQLIQQARRNSDLDPLEFHPEQSRVLHRLANYLYASNDDIDADLAPSDISRGLRAGWKIDRPILDAFSIAFPQPVQTPADLFEDLVLDPYGRSILADPEADLLAVAVTVGQKSGNLTAYVYTYQTVESRGLGQRVERAVDHINDVRDENGVHPIRNDGSVYAVAKRIADQLEAGEFTPREAELALQQEVVDRWDERVWTNVTTTQSLDSFDLSQVVEEKPIDRIALVVAPYQPPSRAHTSYVVLGVWAY
jgi:hypothetical protein